MITSTNRFWVTAEAITGDEHTGYIIDWDQRRWYAVNGPNKLLPAEQGKEIDILRRHIDGLSRNVYSITVDDEGLLVSISTSLEDDPTLIPHYPRYANAPSLQECPTIRLSKLTELDRLGPKVDLMSYLNSSAIAKKVVFKYSILFQWRKQIWDELHLTKSLPRHPNLVSFDRIVIDDAESRVLGFTTVFIPGGTLHENQDRVFRLEWLQQLTAVVDYLNLDLGIVHQDIAPRNLLVDPETSKIRLFDFDRAARVGQPACIPERNDVTGVIFTLYEIVTQDEHFRRVPFEEQDPEAVQHVEWPIRCELNNDIALYRNHLNDWIRQRRQICEEKQVQKVPAFNTPDIPRPTPLLRGKDETGEPVYEAPLVRSRADALRLKENIISWERPPQRAIKLQ
ncbi:hypothetical protein EV356DRAFT_141961 [Viridothelium virens]|uniref:EKC/KEOPS complex subunit BUD32 n=1 Tax=Viridothelium virens TaxID=1048519 RepID=A0A6A6HB46_VIRVR|nr:hypothetical protein EV356DRAFT_141961 [Viridothelium virens]